MSRSTINAEFFTEDNFLELSLPARLLAAYLICKDSVVPVFKAKIAVTKVNFSCSNEDIVSLESIGIFLVDGYWVLDIPYVYYDLYRSPKNDQKIRESLSNLPESVKTKVLSVKGIDDKLGRSARAFMSPTTPIEAPIELKEPKAKIVSKPENSPAYLEDMTDEVAAKFAEKYDQSVEVIKKQAFKCASHHQSKKGNNNITDWNRAFHTWMSNGYDLKSNSGEVPFTDLSHLGQARVERRNY